MAMSMAPTMAQADFSLDHRRGSGLRKARCVRRKMAQGMNKTRARRACGVKKGRR